MWVNEGSDRCPPDAETPTEPKTDREIADLCRRLAAVLNDPEPGLFMWAEARSRLGRELHDALGNALGDPR